MPDRITQNDLSNELETARKIFKSRQRGGNEDPCGIHFWLIFSPSSFSSYKSQEQRFQAAWSSCSVSGDTRGHCWLWELVLIPSASPTHPVTPAIPSTNTGPTRNKKNIQIWVFLLLSTSICPNSNQQWLQLLKKPQILDLIIQGWFLSFICQSRHADPAKALDPAHCTFAFPINQPRGHLPKDTQIKQTNFPLLPDSLITTQNLVQAMTTLHSFPHFIFMTLQHLQRML